MASHRRIPFALCTAMLAAVVLLSSCAEQDLYEPPGAPFTRVGQVDLPSENEGVACLDRFAFVAGGQAGLHAVDFSNPSAPVLLGTINTQKYSESVEVVRTFVNHTMQDIALVVEGTEGITSYDVTDPDAMVDFQTGTTAVFGNRVCVVENEDPDQPFLAFLAESWKGVRIFESLPAQPGILAYNGVFSGTNGYAEGVDYQDGFAYVADDEMGLAVLDARVLSLGEVQLVSWCDSPGEALDVEVQGGYAYVADGPDGLAIYAIDGGETPVHTAQLPLEGTCQAIAVRDDLAVLCARGSGVHFVDISDPAEPFFLGRVLTEYAMDLAISSEGLILVADRDEGLVILDRAGGGFSFADNTPPLAVTSLTARSFSLGAVRLDWVMTGDDRLEGLVQSMDIRMATTPIADQAAWEAAAVLGDLPSPEAPGTPMSHVVSGLTADQEYHFAVRLRDDAGNLSPLAGSVAATAGGGILLLDPQLDIQGGSDQDQYTYRVTFVYATQPDVAQVIIDGDDVRDMVLEEALGDGTYVYVLTTLLAAGDHTYSFHFGVDDAEVADATTPTASGPVVGAVAFTMGSPATGELGREADEWQHRVVLSHDIEVGVYEVTQGQWQDMGLANPSIFGGNSDLPVENVTWLQAVEFCNALSSSQGLSPAYTVAGQQVSWDTGASGWRLPTEAEWEYAARAGTSTAFAGGPITQLVCNSDPVLAAMGWYCGSDFGGGVPATSVVGQLQANDNGLYDMHGNVWEWCWDWYGDYRLLDTDGDGVVRDPQGPLTGDERVVRGGSWYGGSEACRSASRSFRFPDSTDNTVGLRVVRTLFDD